MKKITVEVPNDVADAFEKLSPAERADLLKASLRRHSREWLEELLDRTAKQAREKGMTEKEIEDFLASIS
jgi:Mg/Co/Ni transporter MgtE